MKIKFKLNFNNIGLILTVVFVLILLAELYYAYFNLFTKMTVTDDAIIPTNIVRVNLQTYQDTIEQLDEAETFVADPFFPPRSNPFK